MCVAQARVPAGSRIDSVSLYMYRPWGGITFAPYEVWLGDGFGQLTRQCTVLNRTQGGGRRGGGYEEPSHGGAPSTALCDGAAHDYVTLLQLGTPRRWQLSELRVFAPSAAPLVPPALPPIPPREIGREIAERFEAGRPSDVLAEASGGAQHRAQCPGGDTA